MARRKRYSDKFRAAAVVMLEAEGYPGSDGALTRVAGHLDVPLSTLRGWFTAEHNPPPTELRNEKKSELRDLLETELREAVRAMANARPEASYRDLGTVAAIFTDKVQLLDGKPTERVEESVTVHDSRERLAQLIDRRASAGRARLDTGGPH